MTKKVKTLLPTLITSELSSVLEEKNQQQSNPKNSSRIHVGRSLSDFTQKKQPDQDSMNDGFSITPFQHKLDSERVSKKQAGSVCAPRPIKGDQSPKIQTKEKVALAKTKAVFLRKSRITNKYVG